MRSVLVPAVAALLLASMASRAETVDTLKRTLPHQEECATPLPTDFWDNPAAKPFKSAEEWAWNKRICIGQWADMRNAPGGSGRGEECQPAEIEKSGRVVPDYRELRPEFLELILSHEPWSSAQRHPQVFIRCALVRGNIALDDHEIAPTFGFHEGAIDGDVGLVGSKFKRTLSLRGSSITGRLRADRLDVGGGLVLREGGSFTDIDLRGARIAGEASFNGSTVAGILNADGLKVGGSLFLHDGGMFSDIDFLGAKVAGDVAIVGSTVNGLLTADGLEVGGSLILRGGSSFTGIRLLGARIANNAEFNSSTVTGLLNADRLRVGGSLFLRDGGSFADIDLLGATIAGNAEFNASTVAGKLNADRLRVGGNLLLRDGGMFADIDLLGARIGSIAEFDGSNVAGKLNAPGMEIGGSLYLRHGGAYAEIDLLGAKIGGDVQLAGGVFGGDIDLTGATVGGELHLASGWLQHPPTWQSGASLILRNTKADVLQAQADSWNMSEGDRLLPTDLTGFTFSRLGGLDTSGGASMGDESVEWLIGWIEAQRDHGDIYDPQPYTQLAQVLEAAGATGKADAIRYAKFEHKRDHDESLSTLGHAVLTLERITWGYGVYPVRLLCWFGGLVLLGGLLAQFSKEPSVRQLMGLWYSLDNALPLIHTTQRFKSVDHGRAWLAHIFHFQKVLGFVIVTVWVGTLALLSG